MKPLLLDGATGSNLITRGMPPGICVEEWVIKNPDKLVELQKEFIAAGSDIIYAPTFSANRIKLSQFELKNMVTEYNTELVILSKEAVKSANKKVMIAGNISPTGEFIEPFGDRTFIEIMNVYTEQAEALSESGVDLFVIETMMSLTEMRAAVMACLRFKLPIYVTVTVDENGRTLMGATALSCLISLQGMGISAFGLNCSYGADKMVSIFEEIAPYAHIPLIAKPNAGQPDNNGEYSHSPKEMAKQIGLLLEKGVRILGGCCGTTPQHIAEIRKEIDSFVLKNEPIRKPDKEQDLSFVVANETQVFHLSEDGIEISDSIECEVDMADELLDICSTNIDIISVQLHTPDDAYHFSRNAHMAKLPVCFITDDVSSLASALMYYDGRAMIDSNCDIPREDMNELAIKYGAVIY